ncbi:heat shock protein beta-3-like [Acipenser oxyrinchus oxyrinchus]|uniref:Heat shock protein beta-3-like n=1 Tax=Acipenser oxyrinchus oxyrinchus TaxID=40147 RepID=A0AAD8FR42_ACIOX|nr:heat shock protein beta-3-like [Acipenser oxyrinchus oxyrinchus]KAK1148392.1 heat shock protein beta-3-like [Acipenser oxyrinchus oxyrinchus]
MEGVTVRHWLKCPVRYQAWFAEKNLEECKEEHSLFACRALRPGLKLGNEEAATGETGREPAFQVLLGVAQFRPEEILIQVYEGWLLVKSQHGPRMDQHGFISRSFTRQYKLPDGLPVRGLSAVLCHDGILVVETRH